MLRPILFFAFCVLFAQAQAQSTGFYKHLKGTVGTAPATMDLVKWYNATTPEAGYTFKGYYYYDKYQQPISLYGEVDSLGQMVLHEYNWAYGDIVFMGKMDKSGAFSGIWSDTSANKTFEFVFKEACNEGCLPLDNFNFSDSVKLWPTRANSPKANYGLQVLLPQKKADKSLSKFLKQAFFSQMNGDSLERDYSGITPEKYARLQKDLYFKSYVEMFAEENPNDYEEMPFMLFGDDLSTMSVLHNEGDLLSVGFGTYSYAGGVHGNHATQLATYDLKTKQALTLEAVFLPNFEQKLNVVLAYNLRRTFGLAANAPLSEVLFDDKIEFTTNFCLTPKGILFLYNPYEIAAYAAGEIEIFVPFKELKGILQPRWAP